MVSLTAGAKKRRSVGALLPFCVSAFSLLMIATSVISCYHASQKIAALEPNQRKQHILDAHDVPKSVMRALEPEPPQRNQSVLGQVGREPVLDCLIIGAGWAGLGAGIFLRKHNIENFEILDARNYVGGRSRTVYDLVDNVATELGSAFLYRHRNSVRSLADARKVKFGEIDYKDENAFGLYDEKGEVVGSRKKNLMKKEWVRFAAFTENVASMLDETIMDKSFQATIDHFIRKSKVTKRVRRFLLAMIQAKVAVEFAAKLNKISTVNVAETIREECLFCDGADYYLAVEGGGFDKAIAEVAVPLKPHLRLKTPVTKIRHDGEDELIQVTYVDEDGISGTKRARTVLVTASLGVLKVNDIAFDPPLPQSKQDAIDFLSFGTLNKCIFYWESPQDMWWPKGKTWMTYMPTDEKKSGKWTSFFNDRDLGNGGHYILSSWSGGSVAEAAEQDTDEETVAIVLSNLRDMFGPQVPPPSKYIITRWGEDEFTRGSYSYATAHDANNERQTAEAREELGRPVGKKLYFAGEATAGSNYGTTYGAFDSGTRAGKEVVYELKSRMRKENLSIK